MHDPGLANTAATLSALADKARRAYGRNLEAWIECAAYLQEARAVANHGDWLPFLQRAGIPERTGQRMLLVAERGLKSDMVSDLGGIGAALDFVRITDAAWANLRRALEDCEPGSEEHYDTLSRAPDGPVAAVEWIAEADEEMHLLFLRRLLRIEGAPME